MRLPWQRGGDERADAGGRSATVLRDERLSEYLDGSLSRPDAVAVEASADHDSEARLALEGMRAVRAHLGELGMVRAPRSFTLAPQNAPRQRGLPRIELYTRLATAAAVLALTATTLAPSFTASVDERATSISESFDAAAPNEVRKQNAEQAPQPAPATAAADARSAAPTSAGAPGAGGSAELPRSPEPLESSGSLATAAAPPAATAATTPAPALPPPSEQPVPLSNGVARSEDSSVSTVQVGLAAVTSLLAALSLGLWFRRARGI